MNQNDSNFVWGTGYSTGLIQQLLTRYRKCRAYNDSRF